jgi:hypothetical protein
MPAMNRKAMQRLIWKDSRTLAPLAIGLLAGVFLFNVLQWFSPSPTDLRFDDRLWVAYGTWILLPNLLALGAPALLVGGEEESGALALLRTLPAQWKAIAYSKLLVAGVALFILYLVGTIGFRIQWDSFPEFAKTQLRNSGSAVEPFSLHAIGQIGFSVVLLLVSFATAYLFRSPVSALVAVVPMMLLLAYGFSSAGDSLTRNGYGQTPWGELVTSHPWWLSLLGAVVLLILFGINQWAARRRFSAPESNLKRRMTETMAGDAFRPPAPAPTSWYAVSLVQQAPRRSVALLWQTLRQTGWAMCGALGAILFGLLLIYIGGNSPAVPVGGAMIAFSMLLIGGMTFYGDSVRKRCVFLYDRGVPATTVWATRVGPTLLAAVVATGMILLAVATMNQTPWWVLASFCGTCLGFYALCQFLSIWAPRPILVFFAVPVLFALAALGFAPLFRFYDHSVGILLVCVPLLLFASWRMTPAWMAGHRGGMLTAKAVGYLTLGLAIPYVLILGGRWATTPVERTSWQERMLSMKFDVPRADARPFAIADPELSASVAQLRAMNMSDKLPTEGLDWAERLRLDVADSAGVGRYVDFGAVVSLAGLVGAPLPGPEVVEVNGPGMGFEEFYQYPPLSDADQLDPSERRELDLLAAKALAKWSRVVREKALVGEATFAEVRTVDATDEVLAGLIEHYLLTDDPPAGLRELPEVLPTPELSRRSRVAALATAWKLHRQGNQRTLFHTRMAPALGDWQFVERRRRERFVDEAAWLMFDQLQSGANFGGLADQERLEDDLIEANVVPARRPADWKRGTRALFAQSFPRLTATDQRFQVIRNRLNAMKPEM